MIAVLVRSDRILVLIQRLKIIVKEVDIRTKKIGSTRSNSIVALFYSLTLKKKKNTRHSKKFYVTDKILMISMLDVYLKTYVS